MKRTHMIPWTSLLLFLLWPAAHALAGTVTGTVKVNGLRSPANILIYLNKAPQPVVDLSGARFTMDQQNLTFIPQVLPVPVGATVLFPNNDKVDHNIFSLSRTKAFNLGSYQPGEHRTVVFDQPGIVELRCDVHAEMQAVIMVMKNPYFGVTDEQGRFTIPDTRYLESHGITGIPELPAGSYVIKNRHAKLKTDKQTVLVPATGTVEIQLSLSRGTPGVLFRFKDN